MRKGKLRRNRLDERQEQKLLQIEHNGCWIAFWGLATSLFVGCCLGLEWRNLVGEWIVFMGLSFYIVIACLKNGIWDRKLEPTPKVNLCASIIAGIVCGVLQFARSYRKYQALAGSAAAGVFMLVFTVAVCYATVSFVAFLYRRRVERLESEEEEDEEDEQ